MGERAQSRLPLQLQGSPLSSGSRAGAAPIAAAAMVKPQIQATEPPARSIT
ncbi:hypothetical protein ACE6H2_003832 [Prunus campanulata]